ncbi:glycosyltransferase [Polynucleobacter sp. JS-Fieb-80-E5]|uniref:glycosyltransferase family protein n=1 Tax=Polynucleobacter sp. JS-Fieb-80-E5 TaxID=2081050 RepID=UPI001C0DE53C|nr:glycosyltransferase [Polynucleobacter sp. JS-Fieb-80-E5]MBU3618787.1 glycosyltransferase [Polynucleobacter sp. JS-Fieb-80-E5]
MIFKKKPLVKSQKNNILGYVEYIDNQRITGWAWNKAIPLMPLAIEIIIDEIVVAEVVADNFRPDLVAEKIGKGFHGFEAKLPIKISSVTLSNVLVRVKNTNFFLPRLPEINPLMDVQLPQKIIFGSIESVTPYEVKGFYEKADLNSLLHIQAFKCEDLIADYFIEDSSHESLNRGLAFFEINLLKNCAQSAKEIRIEAQVNGVNVNFQHTEDDNPKCWGDLRVVNSSSVEGWVCCDLDGNSREVEILLGEKVIWRGLSRRMLGNQAIGFKVDLPLVTDWEKMVTISARRVEDGLEIGSPVYIIPRQRFDGAVDFSELKNNILTVSGWALDKGAPFKHLELKLYLDGKEIGETIARDFRPDLVKIFKSGDHGFKFSIPQNSKNLSYEKLVISAMGVDIIHDIDLKMIPDEPESEPDLIALSKSKVTGKLDYIEGNTINGWMIYEDFPRVPVLLDVFIDNNLYLTVTANKYRPDLDGKFKKGGNHCFLVKLPPNFYQGNDFKVTVIPRYGIPTLIKSELIFTSKFSGQLNAIPNHTPYVLNKATYELEEPQRICFIVLNLNGAHHLVKFFESFKKFILYPEYEIMVVDHGSSDNSLDICKEWSKSLNLNLIERGKNYSFSESNNYAAKLTDTDILIFVNNDIVFVENVAGEIIDVLNDKNIGLVGIKLLDPPIPGFFSMPLIQHLGVHFNLNKRDNIIEAFESRYAPQFSNVANGFFEVPAVTGAFIACRREEFLGFGGFDEQYYYGAEDVDLCLNYSLGYGKKIISINTVSAIHDKGSTRFESKNKIQNFNIANNWKILNEKYAKTFRKHLNRDRFTRPGFWSGSAPRVAFAVSEVGLGVKAGDYFTALELAKEFLNLVDCQIVFLDSKVNWYDLYGIDVVISMLDTYDLQKISNQSPHLIKIAWARNWIDRWAQREWVHDYDLVFSSSEYSSAILSRALSRNVPVMRLATNYKAFSEGIFKEDLASDYCSTCSFFNVSRSFTHLLNPSALPFKYALYGHGWNSISTMSNYWRGSVPYSEMPNVYASTKIVIDDANSATREFGSVNSRVYDAIASGALVITNGALGSTDAFDGILPVYSSSQELESLIWKYLSNDESRIELVKKLQEKILSSHTYHHRASQLLEALVELGGHQKKISIKIGAPSKVKQKEWGDYHFALGVKRALTRLGHSVRIDCIDNFYINERMGDDVVIVLRGLASYTPTITQINVMWVISHPDDITLSEYESYDHVFIASEKYVRRLLESTLLKVNISTLLQCTDPEIFNPEIIPKNEIDQYLFVGNSRGVFRDVVRLSLKNDIPLAVYGPGWEGFIPSSMLKDEYIPNEILASFYKGAHVVFNDHWKDMRDNGFISNRIFDVVATGGLVVTDYVEGIGQVFESNVLTYADEAEFIRIIEKIKTSKDCNKVASSQILSKHTFDQRIQEIIKAITTHEVHHCKKSNVN